MVSRVLRDLGGGQAARSSCSTTRRTTATRTSRSQARRRRRDKERARTRNEDARVWFTGLQAIAKQVGHQDRSTTCRPRRTTCKGSGYNEGFIFPWMVSDFSLMDAIESGIVKVPRIAGRRRRRPTTLVTYLRLWDHVGDQLPKRAAKDDGRRTGSRPRSSKARCAASTAATRRRFDQWEKRARAARRAAAGDDRRLPEHHRVEARLRLDRRRRGRRATTTVDRPQARRARAALATSSTAPGSPRPRTILIDSRTARVRRGDEGRLQEGRRRGDRRRSRTSTAGATPAPTSTSSTDEDLLREVMNTVGKKGRLGEHVRCVVCVSMLTEGWDANTVTHILGIRAFGSQLLCEQVVGRGLRRRIYAVNDEGTFEPEYAEVYGVPFAVHLRPTSRSTDPLPPKPAIEVARARGPRATCASRSRSSTATASSSPTTRSGSTSTTRPTSTIGPNTVADAGSRSAASSASASSRTATRRSTAPSRSRSSSPSGSSTRSFDSTTTTERPWLFPQLVGDLPATGSTDVSSPSSRLRASGYLLTITEAQALAAEAVWNAIVRHEGNRRERLRPMLDRFDPVGSTDDVDFLTRKVVIDAEKSAGHPCHARRQGRQHLGGDPGQRARAARTNVHVLREERPPRLHDPLRARGAKPPATSRTSSSGSTPGDDDDRAHAHHRGVGQPEEPRADRRRRPTPPATSGAPRSTTTAASAAGATSRSTTRRTSSKARLDDAIEAPVRRRRRSSATARPARLQRWQRHGAQDSEARTGPTPVEVDHPRRQADQHPDRRRPRRSSTPDDRGGPTGALPARPERSTRSSCGRARTSEDCGRR